MSPLFWSLYDSGGNLLWIKAHENITAQWNVLRFYFLIFWAFRLSHHVLLGDLPFLQYKQSTFLFPFLLDVGHVIPFILWNMEDYDLREVCDMFFWYCYENMPQQSSPTIIKHLWVLLGCNTPSRKESRRGEVRADSFSWTQSRSAQTMGL